MRQFTIYLLFFLSGLLNTALAEISPTLLKSDTTSIASVVDVSQDTGDTNTLFTCGVMDSPQRPHFGVKPPANQVAFVPRQFAARPNLSGLQPQETVHIDMMFVFDQHAKNWLTSKSDTIDDFSQKAIDRLNLAMANSQINVEFHLAHKMTLTFGFPQSCRASLDKAINWMNGDYFSDIAALDVADVEQTALRNARNTYHADLVSFFTFPDDDRCGTGGAAGTATPNPTLNDNTNFSAININAALAAGNSLVHEVGHNFGAAHDASNGGPNSDFGANYPAGWYFQYKASNNSTLYAATMMAYRNIIDGKAYNRRELVFSSPDVTFQGAVTGNQTSGDNRRVLIENAKYIERFRHNPNRAYTPVSLNDALDIPSFDGISGVSTDSTKPWFGQKTLFVGDTTAGDAAQTPVNLGNGESSSIKTTITKTGDLSFYSRAVKKAGSNATFDLYVGGTKVKSLIVNESQPAEQKFIKQAIRIDTVPVEVEWRFTRNSSRYGQEVYWNMAFIDKVSFVPDSVAPVSPNVLMDSFEERP